MTDASATPMISAQELRKSFGVVLCRELTTGLVTSASAVSVCYLLVMGLIGLAVVRHRLDRLLLT